MIKVIASPDESKKEGESRKTQVQKQKPTTLYEKYNTQLPITYRNSKFYKDIVETIHEPLLVLDSGLRVLFANRHFYSTFKFKTKETIGQRVYDLGNRQWDIPLLRTLLEEIIPEKNKFNDYQIEHDFPVIGKRIMLLNARRIINPLEKKQLILLAIEDVTTRINTQQSLQLSEERFREACETAKDGMLLVDKSSGNIIVSNQAAEILLGYPLKKLREKALWEFGFIKDFKQFQKLADQLGESDLINFIDINVMTKNGREIPTDIYLTDRTKLIQCNIRDISDRKQVEGDLEISEERFRSISSLTPDHIIMQDCQLKYLFVVNPQLGLKESEMLGKTDYDFLPRDEADRLTKIKKQVLKSGKSVHFETSLLSKTGGTEYFDGTFVPRTAAQGQVIGLIGYFRNVTDRKLVEEAQRQIDKKYAQVIETTNEGIWITDADFKITYVNPRMCSLLGYSSEEIIGHITSDFFLKEDLFGFERLKKQRIKGIAETYERRLLRKDGETLWTLVSANPQMDELGKFVGNFAQFTDITEQKQLVEKLTENEKRYHELFNHIGSGVAVYEAVENGSNFIFKEYNAAGEKLDKAQHKRIIGRKVTEVFPGIYEMGLLDTFRRVWKTGIPEHHPASVYKDENLMAWRENYVYKLPSGEIVSVFEDITESKRMEMELRESEENFRSLYENATIGLYRTNPAGDILLANPALLKMLGYTAFEQLAGRNLNKEGFEPDYPRQEFKRRIEEESEVHGLESIWKRQDGSTIHVRESARVIKDKSKHIQYYEGTVEDVSERFIAEKALHQSEDRYRNLFKESPISLWEEDFSAVKQRLDALREKGVTNLHEYLESHPREVSEFAALVRIIDVNNAGLGLFKAKKREDLLNISPPSFKDFRLELENIAEGRTKFYWDGVNQTLTGENIDVSFFWSAMPGHESDLSKVILSISDITQRKQSEREMQRLIGELRHLSEAEKKNRLFAEALAQNAITLNKSIQSDEILDGMIENLSNVVPFDAASIMILKDETASIVRSSGYEKLGLSDWARSVVFDINKYPNLNAVVKSGNYIVTSDTNKSAEWHRLRDGEWIKSSISAPILEDKKVIGFLNVDNSTPGFYNEEYGRKLMTFTDQVSNALKNARLFEATQQRLHRMQAMTQIDQAINSNLDLNFSLEVVLTQTKDQLNADAVDILLVNNATDSLVFSKARGFKTDEIRKSNLGLGTGFPSKAVLERTLVAIPDLNSAQENFFRKFLVEKEGFRSYYCAPLVTKGELKGVMEVYFRNTFLADPDWKEFLEMLAQQTAIAINNAELLSSLQASNIELVNAYETTLRGWVNALDMRDHETERHTQRVTEISLKLARQMGIKESGIVNFERGALLHDIGKVAISDAILKKPGPLTVEEWAVMHQHPLYAYQLLSKSKYLIPALDIPYCHHEKWDGSGYPRGLKGEEIPLAARIFAIVDVWDALISDRPYRKAWSKKKALKYIQEQSGIYFDPEVVRIFIQNLDDFDIKSN